MDTSPPFCLQKIIIDSPLFLESSNVEGLGGGQGSCYTPKNWHVLWRGFNISKGKFHRSNHWLSKAMIDTLLGTIIAPSQTLLKMIISFSKISQGGMLVWRIPSKPMPPWPPQLPPCAVFGSRHELLSPKCSWNNAYVFSELFFWQIAWWKWENPTKTEIPLCKCKFRSEKSVSLNGFCLQEWPIHTVIRLGSGIKFPTPNIIYPEFHANLHSRLLISSISRLSHSFSKYKGKGKVCKQCC